jgi:TP901 family phage tail tape measure protein
MAQKVIFELVVQDVGLTARIEQTRQSIRDLNKEIRQNPGPERFAQIAAELSKNRRELTELNKQQKELNREMNALKVPKDSLAGLRLEYSKLSQAVAQLSAEERKSQFGQSLIKNARNVKSEIDGVEQSIGRFTGNVGNYRSALNGIGQAFAALGIGASLGEIIGINTRISDSIADVAKTAGITTAEAQKLADTLEFRDTRTSLVDQLQIAQIGGQLGIANNQLETFTESVDVLNVSLGDQFGGVEEITRVIAGLRNVLTDFRTDDVSGDVLKLGNALNFLEAQGAATAPTIAEFVNRISGTAVPLGISTDKIFGLSTALAELAINPERGATAISNLLRQIAASPEVFAKTLDVPVEEFSDLVRTDLVGALSLVAVKIKEGAADNIEFSRTLDDLGIDRQGTIEALGKLGGNIGLLDTRIRESGEALQATDSVYAEFDKKNNNAAAAVAKLQNSIVNLIASEGAQDAIEGVAKAVTGLVTILGEGLKIISENSTEFAALGIALASLSGPGQKVAAVIGQLIPLLNSSAAASATATVATEAQTVATVEATAATRFWAAAQAALPLLYLVAGIYAIVKAIEIYNTNLSAADKATRAVADAQEEIAQSSAKEVTALNNSIEILKSATASQRDRELAIKTLNERYPEYLKNIELDGLGIEGLTKIQRELTKEILSTAVARAKTVAQDKVAAKIVESQLKEQRLFLEKQQGGGGIFNDLDFKISVEQNKQKEFQKELQETGAAFDGLKERLAGGPDLTQNLFGVSLTGLEDAKKGADGLVDLATLTKEQLEKLGTDAAKAEIARRDKSNKDLTDKEKAAAEKRKREKEKAAEDEAKAVEAQQKRIKEINKSIRDLQLGDENTFDGKLEALENRRVDALQKNADRLEVLRAKVSQQTGKPVPGETGAALVGQIPNALPADITEAQLIDVETAAIGGAFDDQRNELFRQRERTQKEQEEQLRSMIDEVNRIAADNEAAIAESVGRDIEQSFTVRRDSIEREFKERNESLLKSLSTGEISQRQFDEQEISNSIEQSNRIIALEQERATRITEVTEQIKEVKIAAAKAALDAELNQIDRQRGTDVQQVEQDATLSTSDAAARISAINEKASEDAKAAQIDYANTVKDTTADATAAQLSAVDAVAAAEKSADDAKLKRIAEEAAAREQVKAAAIDTAGQIADGILQIQQNRAQQEADAEIAALDEQYAKRIEAAQGNAVLQAKLEKELAEKKEKVQKEQAEKSKKFAIVQAVIDTALSVLKALGSAPPPFNFILAGLAAAAGAVQIAVIKSQQFAAGGFADDAQQPGQSSPRRKGKTAVYPKAFYDRLPDFSGIGGFTGAGGQTDSTGRPVAGKLSGSGAVVHAGEYVAPASQVAQFPALFEHLDAERTKIARPFADGGFTGTNSVNFVRIKPFAGGGFSDPVIGLPNAAQLQSQSISVSAQASFTNEQVQQIGQIIAAENAKVTRQALADGIGDANRRLEREQSLEQQRTV